MLDLARDAVRCHRKMKAPSPVAYYLTFVFYFMVLFVVPTIGLASRYSTYCDNSLAILVCVAVTELTVLFGVELICGWNWLRYIFDVDPVQ